MDAQSEARRLPWLICAGWGVGTVATSAFINVMNLLALRFMTDFLGIAAGVAGLLFAGSKLYNAFFDPMLGTISDRARFASGRRRPFLVIGGVLCGLALVAFFHLPAGGSKPLLFAFAVGALLLYATAFSVFNVPYIAMATEMTRNAAERSFLMSFRVVGGAVGQLLASNAPLIVLGLGGGMAGYRNMSWVLAAVVLLMSLLCFYGTRAAPFVAASGVSRSTDLLQQLRACANNRPFIALLVTKLALFFGIASGGATAAYFVKYVLGVGDQYLAWIGIGLTVGTLASQPLWLALGRRCGKRLPYMYAAACYMLLYLSWLFARGEPMWIFIARITALGVAAGGLVLMSQSLLPDTIAYDVRHSGQHREGMLSGLYTTVEKGAYVLGLTFTGLVLEAYGYVKGGGAAGAAQPDSVLTGIALCYAIVPAVCAVLSAVAVRWVRLDAESSDALTGQRP
jgi:GPH family glycoside/pentoside/hexuronide:cation symporter